MSFPNKRVDQVCVVISEPFLQVKHYTIAEVRGVVVNFSSDEIYIADRGMSLGPQSPPGITNKVNPDIPSILPAHSSTGEILLITLEINRDSFDAIENMMVGSIILHYTDSSRTMYQTAPALFQLLLITH